MRKLLVITLFFLGVLVSSVNAKTVKIGEQVFMSPDTAVNLTCNIVDDGVGMQEGLMKFRASYEDAAFSAWTEPFPFSNTASVTLVDIITGKRFSIQGLFADSLGNWQLESTGPKTPELYTVDSTPPNVGSLETVPDVIIHIN